MQVTPGNSAEKYIKYSLTADLFLSPSCQSSRLVPGCVLNEKHARKMSPFGCKFPMLRDGEMTDSGQNKEKISHFTAGLNSHRDMTRFCRGECHSVTGAKGCVKPAPQLTPSCMHALVISQASPPCV